MQKVTVNTHVNWNITHNCGKFKVWSELQYLTPGITKSKYRHGPKCFDPVLYPGAMEQLYKAMPHATIVTLRYQNPAEQWFAYLPKDLKQLWRNVCNPLHGMAFPSLSLLKKSDYIQFYKMYYQTIDDFVEQHSNGGDGWTQVVVNMDATTTTSASDNTEETGSMLQDRLGIPSHCWADAVKGTMIQPAWLDTHVEEPKFVPRPNDIQFPIFVASLPKSGTSAVSSYFKCGMGNWTAKHHWTTPSASTLEKPLENIPIGKCMKDNLEQQKKHVLAGCGTARVWSDAGYMTPPSELKKLQRQQQHGLYGASGDASTGDHLEDEDEEDNAPKEQPVCFYPTLHGGLEAFASAYPRGTILQVVRDVTDWVESASKWSGNLLERWSNSEQCTGFPPPQSTQAVWEDFYRQHTQRVRDFATKRPNMTYIELPLSKQTGELLHDIYGFHPSCWK